ncbi:hypothetical protein NDU88_003084 [Pleurodeles waltl]|uniref:Uncharacterized protein n=1 Tax=Pleurodeles waltl TaxID=8319 RepID=A0AAV7M7T1_PLEWA|nr:hypothetical protein NDU88_003084 [Pleurodeles waltl]
MIHLALRSGVACLKTREQAGMAAEVLRRRNVLEDPATSQSTDSFLHLPGLEEKTMDYEEGGDVEESEIVDNVDVNLGNIGSGSLTNGGGGWILQQELSKKVQHVGKGGREEMKCESVHIPRGEKKGTSDEGSTIIRFVSVAIGNILVKKSAFGVNSMGGKDICIQEDVEGDKHTLGLGRKLE